MYGSPHRKESRLLGANLSSRRLCRACSRDHEHILCQGSAAKQSAIYTKGLAEQIAYTFADALRDWEPEQGRAALWLCGVTCFLPFASSKPGRLAQAPIVASCYRLRHWPRAVDFSVALAQPPVQPVVVGLCARLLSVGSSFRCPAASLVVSLPNAFATSSCSCATPAKPRVGRAGSGL